MRYIAKSYWVDSLDMYKGAEDPKNSY